METRNPRPSLQSLPSQDDGGLWMKMDSHRVTNHTESPSVTSDETPQDEAKVIPAAPAAITTYYSVMDDESADDVFISPPPPLPPFCMAPLLSAEGSTGPPVNNSDVTLSNGAADATEAKANLCGLDWHPSETQVMTAQKEQDEVRGSTQQTSCKSMDNVLLPNDKDSASPTYLEQTPMDETRCLMETCHDAAGRQREDNTTGIDESNEDPKDFVILSGGQDNWEGSDAERDKYSKQNHKENSENVEKERDNTHYEDICGLDETGSKQSRENLDTQNLETNAPTLPGIGVNKDDFGSPEPAELCKYSQNKKQATNQPQVPDLPADMTNDEEEYVDSRSLNYNLKKCDLLRRESGTPELQEPQLPDSKGSDEMVTKGEQEDGSRRIATDIQQGEQLLQRLQLVQLRHDVHMSENPPAPQQLVKEMTSEERGAFGTEVEDLRVRGRNLSGDEEKEGSRFHSVQEEEAKTNLVKTEKNEGKVFQTKARTSLSIIPGEPEQLRTAETKAGDSDDDQRDSWTPVDLFPINPQEISSTEIQFLSTGHRFSAAETTMERQIHEAVQSKQNLQRAGGVFNLADNPDVLEIPFKTNISLESLPTKAGERSDWQFSEQKMQKEISQEIQRELVLVNQGKIPGGYSKGEVRQLKETKLLFEAFQQECTEGLTRQRKPPTTVMKGHVYPSVLERTRSLERFSLKSCPVSRAHSLRLYNSVTAEREKCPENFRSKSPTGGSRDNTRLFPYSKQDKHLRLHRSMESISNDVSMLTVGTTGKTREASARQESPILKQNPFFKLRPALALQPEVERDIREAKEREEELRRQRCTLYGENRQNNKDEEKSRGTQTLTPDVRQQSRGKLERVWPPPSKTDQMKVKQPQEPKVHRAGGQKAPLWQRWESGLINGQPSKEKK